MHSWRPPFILRPQKRINYGIGTRLRTLLKQSSFWQFAFPYRNYILLNLKGASAPTDIISTVTNNHGSGQDVPDCTRVIFPSEWQNRNVMK